jgi:LPXTG-motif cell wall-anchored protein
LLHYDRTGRLPRLCEAERTCRPCRLRACTRARVSGDVAVMYYVIMGVLLVGLIVLFFYLRKKGQ